MGDMNRREAIGALTVVGVGATLARASTLGSSEPDVVTGIGTGWDAARGEYALPDLAYAYDALEPVIDEATMRIHHEKHHGGYVRGLNTALAALRDIREGRADAGLTEHWMRKLSFNAGGHLNHTLFWSGMAPAGSGGGGRPGGKLGAAIERDFGSYDAFDSQFRASAKSVEGSGWAWLVHEPIAGRLMVLQMHNQQHSVFAGAVPLLGVDVWEHAYYLRYQNRRAEYVDRYMDIVNWGVIGQRYQDAIG